MLALLFGLFGLFTNFYTDLLWFRSVGFSSVFTTQLTTKIAMFVVFGLLMAVAVAGNLIVAYRLRPPYRALSLEQQSLDRYRLAVEPYHRYVVIVVAVLMGILAGTSAAGEWRTWLLWRNRTEFGVKDAQFGKDVSFFAFSYPWWRFLLGFAFAIVILSLIIAALTHYLYGGIRLQTPGDKTSPAARVHLSVLLGVFVLLKAVAYWFDRWGLAFSDRGVATGPSYTDVNALLPAKTILTVIALICAVLFFANVFRRGWQLPGVGLGLLVLSAVLIGGVYPAIVQQFQVRPNEVDREKPYIARNIEATRDAYGLNKVEKTQYTAETAATPGQLREDADTTASVRLLDPTVLPDTYTQLQQVRGFYEFSSPLDVDRYAIDGDKRDVVAAVREVDLSGIPDTQKNWINEHLVYTHGYGFVAAPGSTRDEEGRPVYIEGGIPPSNGLGEYEPRIYYGELSPSYSIVGAPDGAKAREFDYPDDESADGQQNNTFSGPGGVPMGSLFNRLLYATKFQERNILLSSALSDQSKIMYVRNPKDRVAKVAPWLTLDGDPYPAIVNGSIKWILDGYTTTNGYPYSERTTLGEATADSLTTGQRAVVTQVNNQVNYIRNSVKATVDAHDGTVKLYAWDEQDPVLKTWRKAFPGTVEPRSEMSEDLLAHIRFPEDLFKVQRELYSRYHVTDPTAFYGGQDFWRIPADPVRGGGQAQPPYYLTLRTPDEEEPAFSLTSVYVPQRRQNLAAFMSANAEPGRDYGKITVLELPSGQQISGPNQVRNQFRSDPVVGQLVNILERGGSQVQFGNLLTLPVGGGLMYVQPVYVQASGAQTYPLLRKVLVSFGDQIAFEDTLQEGLDAVFQGESGVDVTEPPPTGEVPGDVTPPDPGAGQSPELRAALEDAQQAFDDGQGALQRGDFAAYGEAQERLQAAIERAVEADQAQRQSQSGSAESPSPTPSPGG
ncbi:MAG: UPF0182 family protein [Actinomycetes bacterium]